MKTALALAGSSLSKAAMRSLTHLERLEAESIHIFREVVSEADNPVMLYSVGKDSSVMLHLARKAFHPAPPPFPMLHVASGWDFGDLLAHRDKTVSKYGLELIVAQNEDAEAQGINPFDTGSALYSQAQLTDPLKRALESYGFDAAFGGGRRDEEKARAKERVFSFRSAAHRWDPKKQRPELWNLYNAKKAKGESIRVFPLSNWTELDIWQYIALENIDIVPLYFSQERPTVERDGLILVVDDGRFRMEQGEEAVMRSVRFRTLGCYPLTGATISAATDMSAIIQEMLLATSSERQGRAIDKGQSASMEDKKQEGYF
jgi:sulfate adenylyltransferase subunit 2